MSTEKKIHKRLCPCGSKKYFDNCCKEPQEGSTPIDIKNLVTYVVKESFAQCGFYRGELCLYASYLTKKLLEVHNIRSYIVAGSSKWSGYPTYFQYKPFAKYQEFHAWVVTEFGETVDLTCDAFGNRRDSNTLAGVKFSITPPKTCWDKELNDREYIGYDLGAKSFPVDRQALKQLHAAANNILGTIAQSKQE